MAVPQKVTSELQLVAPSAIIELFELKLTTAIHGVNETYRFHAGVNGKNDGGAIVWDGRSYQAYPVEAEGFEYNGNGQLPRPKLRVSNQLGLITAILLQVNSVVMPGDIYPRPGNDLIGATLTRIRVLAKHIDAVNFTGNTNPYGTPDPAAEMPREIFTIARKVTENRDVVEFELASSFDMVGITAPRRVCIANMCNWVYKSSECGYTGDVYFNDNDDPVALLADDVCSKRLAGCEARFAPVSVTATVTAGSTSLGGLTTNELNKIGTNDPVYGYAIPQGTTVVSKQTTSLTMSQAATAAPSYSRTGTLNATGTALTVSSSANLSAGMTVTGPNIPANTTISSISGTTVTLSIAYNPFTRGSSITKSVTVNKDDVPATMVQTLDSYTTERWVISDTSGIQVNDLAGNNSGITPELPHGTKVYAGTKAESISANNHIVPSAKSQFDDGDQFTAIFWTPVTFSSSTYTFAGFTKYTIRADKNLPFGSFPGVGGFYG